MYNFSNIYLFPKSQVDNTSISPVMAAGNHPFLEPGGSVPTALIMTYVPLVLCLTSMTETIRLCALTSLMEKGRSLLFYSFYMSSVVSVINNINRNTLFALKCHYDENRIFSIEAILRHK